MELFDGVSLFSLYSDSNFDFYALIINCFYQNLLAEIETKFNYTPGILYINLYISVSGLFNYQLHKFYLVLNLMSRVFFIKLFIRYKINFCFTFSIAIFVYWKLVYDLLLVYDI